MTLLYLGLCLRQLLLLASEVYAYALPEGQTSGLYLPPETAAAAAAAVLLLPLLLHAAAAAAAAAAALAAAVLPFTCNYVLPPLIPGTTAASR